MQKHNQYNINFDGYRFYPNVLLISSAVAGPVFYEEKLGYMFREINICSACKTNTKHIGKPIQHEFTELGTVHRKWRYLSNDTTDARTLAHELQARSVRPDFQKYRMLNRDELKTDGRTNPDERSGIGRRLTLRHTFSSELCGGQPGHTNNHNLMDYGSGTGLNRFQWETAHNPAPIGKVFQDDEDGAVTQKKFIVEITENSVKVDEKGYVHITDVPEMPKLIAKITTEDKSITKVKVRLNVEYARPCLSSSCGRDRDDNDWFPLSDWKEINIGTSWSIDFESKTRGGKATFYVKYGEVEQTFVFYIRGKNPTIDYAVAHAKTHNTSYWFYTRIVRHETKSTGTNANQFNPPLKDKKGEEGYGVEWSDSRGCPNQGYPCGWGISQLDNPKPGAEALWNWKTNIDEGKKLLDNKVIEIQTYYKNYLKDVYQWNKDHPNNKIVAGSDQKEGGNTTFTHSSSTITGLGKTDIKYSVTITKEDGTKETVVTDMGEEPTGNEKSFIDASLIKYYNGGLYYKLQKYADITKIPEWKLYRTEDVKIKDNYGNETIIKLNYVDKICSETE